jgi:hypothetical protein
MAASDPKQKPVAKADHRTDATPAADGTAPIQPGGLQLNEAVGAPITTNPPRGVNEPPSNQIADEEAAAGLQKHVQETIDSEEARGWRGARQRKAVPNSAYTLAGVSRGDATPETVVVTPRST